MLSLSICPALTPIWLEKWVFSACGAESAACNMIEYKQLSLPPSLPRGGVRGGTAGIWGGGGDWGGDRTSPLSILTIHKNSPFVLLHASVKLSYIL
jgi:hypothetical protein